MMVPVTLVGADGPVQATAFLDSGSSCSFLTESLLTQLELPTVSGSLETMVLGINHHKFQGQSGAQGGWAYTPNRVVVKRILNTSNRIFFPLTNEYSIVNNKVMFH